MRSTRLGCLLGGLWTGLLMASSAWFIALSYAKSQSDKGCEPHCLTSDTVAFWGGVAGCLWLATIMIMVALSIRARRPREHGSSKE